MKCYLTNLPKDCGCCTHDGPHWLHMDRFSFEMNLRLLRGGYFGYIAFVQAESRRLAVKAHELSRLVACDIAAFELPEGYREKDYQALCRQEIEVMNG